MRHDVERIENDGLLLAVILYHQFQEDGIHFFTPSDLSQQLAYMKHPAGKQIKAHVHNPVPREVHFTQEVLVIRRGRLRVDFYNNDQIYLESRILVDGDVILLAEGGHGFEVLDDIEMIEIKQGPYTGDEDKTRFQGVDRSLIKVKGQQDE